MAKLSLMKRIRQSKAPRMRPQEGVVLLEVLIAVLIFSIGILSMIGMQATAINAVSDAKYRGEAAMIADKLIARMWVDQTNLPSYAASAVPLVPSEGNLPSGKKTIVFDGLNPNRVTVTITWRPPELPASSPDRQFVTETQINT